MSDVRTLRQRLERSFLASGLALLTLPAACAKQPAGSSGSCCSEGEWSTSVEVAKAYASKDATVALGCPSKVARTDADAGAPPGDLAFLEGPTQKLQATGDAGCVYRTFSCCPGGRPLFDAADERRAVVASRRTGARWTRGGRELHPLGTSLAPEMRAAIAHAWLEDALAEHASVASFARATLELMAVGAPPALLAAHQRAGLQEIRHAQRCFALARAYGDRAIDPGPIAIPSPRAGGLVRLACDVLVEGCVAETIGALLASRAREACTLDEPRDALRVIATDEAAHAELAWRTLAWALKEGGEMVVRSVVERTVSLRDERSEDEACAPSALPVLSDLRAHGRLDEAEVRRTTADAWRMIIDPLLAKLSGGSARA